MLSRIEETARKYGMFPEDCTVLCGVSGGADSMAMLCALLELRERLRIREVLCAHLNHCLRGEESDRDERFVRDFCAARGVRLFCGRADVSAESAETGEGLEEAARRLRYAFLEKTAGDAGAGRICTAHTADDNAETVLINLSRGAGINGLCGIPPVRGNVVRPLIRVSRTQVLSYLAAKGVAHVEDSSNADTAYFRNLIRRQVIPAIKSRRPAFSDAVASMTELLRRDAGFLEGLAREAFDRMAEKKPGGTSLDIRALEGLHPSLSSRVLRLCFSAAGGDDRCLSFSHTERLLELARAGAPSGRMSLPGGMRACREYGRLTFEKKTGASAAFEPFRLEDGVSRTVPGYRIEAKRENNPGFAENSLNTFYIKCDIMSKGVFVRPRREGDRFRPPKRGLSKSLKKLFIEAKIPASLRASVPVLVCGEEVVAVAGFGVDERFRASPSEKAVRVEISRL